MNPNQTPEPRSGSTRVAHRRSGPRRPRHGGRTVFLTRAVSGLVLSAAFLACGADGNTGSPGGAFDAPDEPGANGPAAPVGNGNPGTSRPDSSAAGGSGTSSPAGSGEGLGPLPIAPPSASNDTPGTDIPGNDTPGNDTPGNDTPGNDTPGNDTATPVDDPGPVVEEPPIGAEPDTTLIGFASVAAAGLDTTTGGDGGEVVTVTTFADLELQISSPGARVVQVQGTIAAPDDTYVKLRVGSNKSIIGLGADAALEHIGFDVTGWGDVETGTLADFCEPEFEGQFAPVSNVIIRNLTFRDTLGGSSDADAIVVQCYAHHVWLDHNTFLGVPNGNDGAIDIKRGADWVTVSWNHLVGWDKSMLLGHDDANGEQDRGTLHVTYHHNFFENTRQRHPRIRFAHAHVLNNYLFNDASVANRTASYFLVAGVESNVHADGNLIEHAREIYVVGEESSTDALLTFAADNRVVALTPGAESQFQIESNGQAFDPASFYSYAVEDAAQLATTVRGFAGAGKL